MKIYAACCRSATVLDENVFATDEMVLKAIMLAENLLPDPAHSAFYTRTRFERNGSGSAARLKWVPRFSLGCTSDVQYAPGELAENHDEDRRSC
jgi:hypothetical protein